MPVVAQTSTLPVAFANYRSGEAPLHWGQKGIWRVIASLIPHDECENCDLSIPLRSLRETVGAVDPQRCADALAVLLRRHEALRTRIALAEDGTPAQHLDGAGTVHLQVIETEPSDADAAAAEQLRRMKNTPFRHAVELPVRAALVVTGGTVTHALFVMSHMAVDATSVGILQQEFLELLTRGAASLETTSPGLQPLDLALFHHSPEGRELGEQALRYWERTYRALTPTTVRPAYAGPQTIRWWRANLDSRAADLAARSLASELNVSTSAVLLTAFCTELADMAGSAACGIALMSSNRFDLQLRGTVSCLMGYTVFAADLRAPEFRDVVRQCAASSIAAYMSGLVDTPLQIQARDRIRDERQKAVEPGYFFNDARPMEGLNPGPSAVPSASEIREAMEETALSWPEKLEHEFPNIMLTVFAGPTGLTLSLLADTEHVAPPEMEQMLRRMEARLVSEAAARD